ncbi:MAG: hypothetical protein ABSB18_07490 [Candidatus Omnitrophota bacterium]
MENEKPDSAAKAPNRANRFSIIGVYILVALLGIFVSKLFFAGIKVKKPTAHKEAPSSPKLAATTSKLIAPLPRPTLPQNQVSLPSPVKTPTLIPGAFVLNGIFYATDGCYALVNNRIVREGDTVEGAKVTKISDEGVSLESEGNKVFLSSTKIR